MKTLSDRCRKDAVAHPTCHAKAVAVAKTRCKGVPGRGKGACMNANYDPLLIFYCRELVCPNDPFGMQESFGPPISKAPRDRSGKGLFTGFDQDFQVDFNAPTSGVGAANDSDSFLYGEEKAFYEKQAKLAAANKAASSVKTIVIVGVTTTLAAGIAAFLMIRKKRR